MGDPYEFRRVSTDADRLGLACRLLRETWPAHDRFVPEALAWLYAANPIGSVVGYEAWAGETLAAHYATVPIEAIVHGRATRGLLSLNTVTHPKHQGQKLFTRLAERTFEAAAGEGFTFVVGVANANSTPGFTTKLGFTLVSPLDVRVGMGPIACTNAPEPSGFRRVWTRASYAWRIQSPRSHYSRQQIGRTAVLLSKTHMPTVRAVLARVTDEGLAASFDVLPRTRLAPTVWLGLDPNLRWARSAYVPLPNRFKPSPLNLIFRPLTAGQPPLSRDEVRFDAIDFDAY